MTWLAGSAQRSTTSSTRYGLSDHELSTAGAAHAPRGTESANQHTHRWIACAARRSFTLLRPSELDPSAQLDHPRSGSLAGEKSVNGIDHAGASRHGNVGA